MTTGSGGSNSDEVARYVSALKRDDVLIPIDWEHWLKLPAPYESVAVEVKEVTARFNRNGYDWDIHGRLYMPAKEVDPTVAITVTHGGAGSERIMDETPDGRPGLARVLATQGFRVLAMTYPGHYPPGGTWQVSVEDRMPHYLLDRDLPADEIRDRNLKCTFNVICQGFATLIDAHLAGRNILGWGHSTSGPMQAHLHRFVKQARYIGLLGFGSGGPDGWRKQWRDETGAENAKSRPIDQISRRNPAFFKAAGYEDPEDLCPWGGAENYLAWAGKVRSQMKTALCDNQHLVILDKLEEHVKATGLPREEFFDHLQDPDPDWLRQASVLFVVGENDRGHWIHGDPVENKREPWMCRKYRRHGVKRSHVVLIPRYGHVGYSELHNEKIAYLWLWAFKNGYFA